MVPAFRFAAPSMVLLRLSALLGTFARPPLVRLPLFASLTLAALVLPAPSAMLPPDIAASTRVPMSNAPLRLHVMQPLDAACVPPRLAAPLANLVFSPLEPPRATVPLILVPL